MPFKDTPLTEREWQKLDPERHQIRDSCGRMWDVLSNVGEMRYGYKVIAQCPGFGPIHLIMTDKLGGRKIVGENLVISAPFHDSGVRVIELDA